MNRFTQIMILAGILGGWGLSSPNAQSQTQKKEGEIVNASVPQDPQTAQVPLETHWEIKYLPPLRKKLNDKKDEKDQTTENAENPEDLMEFEEVGDEELNVLEKAEFSVSRVLEHQTNHYRSGKKEEKWFYQGFVLRPNEVTGNPILLPGNTEVGYSRSGLRVMPELQWIKKDNFIGKTVFRDRVCHVYDRMGGGVSAKAPPAADVEPVEENIDDLSDAVGKEAFASAGTIIERAYIDVETKLPVAVQTDTELRVYTFSQLENPLRLPESYRKVWNDYVNQPKYVKDKYVVPQ